MEFHLQKQQLKDYKLENFVLSRTSVDLDQELLNDIFQKSRLVPDSKVNVEFIVSAVIFIYIKLKKYLEMMSLKINQLLR